MLYLHLLHVVPRPSLQPCRHAPPHAPVSTSHPPWQLQGRLHVCPQKPSGQDNPTENARNIIRGTASRRVESVMASGLCLSDWRVLAPAWRVVITRVRPCSRSQGPPAVAPNDWVSKLTGGLVTARLPKELSSSLYHVNIPGVKWPHV